MNECSADCGKAKSAAGLSVRRWSPPVCLTPDPGWVSFLRASDTPAFRRRGGKRGGLLKAPVRGLAHLRCAPLDKVEYRRLSEARLVPMPALQATARLQACGRVTRFNCIDKSATNSAHRRGRRFTPPTDEANMSYAVIGARACTVFQGRQASSTAPGIGRPNCCRRACKDWRRADRGGRPITHAAGLNG
jgi:hypothetical protein